jgi:hypothetical protein
LVFDCFSYYVARRGIDGELQSKRVSSLEYLNILSQSERALSISTLEGRCTERLLLTLFRISEIEDDAIRKAYADLMSQKNLVVELINQSDLEPQKVKKVVDFVNGPNFEMLKLDDELNSLDDGSAKFTKLKEALEQPRKQYTKVALAKRTRPGAGSATHLKRSACQLRDDGCDPGRGQQSGSVEGA